MVTNDYLRGVYDRVTNGEGVRSYPKGDPRALPLARLIYIYPAQIGAPMDKRKSFWRTVPSRSFAVFLLGVFSTFSIIGFASDIGSMGQQPPRRLLISVLVSGVFATFYATAGVVLRSNWKALLAIFALHFAVMNFVERWLPAGHLPSALDSLQIAQLNHRLGIDGLGTIIGMALGYACFVYVGVTESRRYFRVHAEMTLAAEIHKVLVPPIDSRIGDFAFYGRTLPSGEVGGDLIDVFEHGGHWIAYIADVSGHGVAPGVVMAMVKSAARMQLSSQEESGKLLERLNSVLHPIKKPEMFATFAYLAWDGERLEYSLAGHPPMLHFHALTGEISEIQCSNLPLGMFSPQEFARGTLDCATGDVFVMLTDGLLEVANSKEEEFGMNGVKAALLAHAVPGIQLGAIFQSIMNAANAYGHTIDDQSMLIIQKAPRLPS